MAKTGEKGSKKKAYLTHEKPKAPKKATKAKSPKAPRVKKVKSPKAKATGPRIPPLINIFWHKIAFEVMKDKNPEKYKGLRHTDIKEGHAGYAEKRKIATALKEANKEFLERFIKDPSIINKEAKMMHEGMAVRKNAGY